MKTVYFAIFHSVLKHFIHVWGQHKNQTNNQVEKIQQKALRRVSFKPKTEPVNSLFQKLNIITLKNILMCKNCMILCNQLNDNQPNNFKEYFSTAWTQHNYNTRGHENRTILKTTINTNVYGLCSVKNIGASDWNKISKDISSKISQRSELPKSLKHKILNAYC